jgi:hypothetical protein
MKISQAILNKISLGFPPVWMSAAVLGACTSLIHAQTQYNFNVSEGNWGTATNWSPEGVPNDVSTTTVVVGSGHTANVDGAYSTGFLSVGSSGVVNLAGSGNSLHLGALGSSGQSLQISGGGGQFTVENGASLTTDSLVIIGSGTQSVVRHPRLTITNASATLNRIQFSGSNDNVQAELVLTQGALLTINSVATGSSTASTLIFNAGDSGFGQMIVNNSFEANKVVNLAVNIATFGDIGTYTLIDADTWSGAFTTITLNGDAYTLGTDVEYNGLTWNMNLIGNDLVLAAIPEARSSAALLAIGSLCYLLCFRHQNKDRK